MTASGSVYADYRMVDLLGRRSDQESAAEIMLRTSTWLVSVVFTRYALNINVHNRFASRSCAPTVMHGD
ncbi:hypothetical protein [Mycobacterium uberis]|uniref:hypothetical protein n=1 Tax=Mycobacterium uberis TaxID=2162698 RepID=UPI0026963D19